ncbi:SRPBCC domain-containing protein [Gracilibacillus caseinilyticus]|uniref:SRPBCC domain-containing protein n=1 Tax=Gracilibacillus caseinilyticus TaxID=2932256 RepID=A0ABY4EYC9_9BACI|nr:SRPBCC domain-containing protein [Gracilibacillus caseinilyticus]UOQ48858.1 SRPBCC domain-containing protein [Gracilibacillus caseinilyticus]
MKKVEDIQQTVLLDADIDKVWKKIASAEGLEQWFMPNDFEPVEGHEFHIQSPFGPSPCKVLEVDEPHKLSFSWDVDGWIITFFLKGIEGITEFTLIHGGWKQADELHTKPDEKSSVIRERMNNGWVNIVQHKLKEVVEQ